MKKGLRTTSFSVAAKDRTHPAFWCQRPAVSECGEVVNQQSAKSHGASMGHVGSVERPELGPVVAYGMG